MAEKAQRAAAWENIQRDKIIFTDLTARALQPTRRSHICASLCKCPLGTSVHGASSELFKVCKSGCNGVCERKAFNMLLLFSCLCAVWVLFEFWPINWIVFFFLNSWSHVSQVTRVPTCCSSVATRWQCLTRLGFKGKAKHKSEWFLVRLTIKNNHYNLNLTLVLPLLFFVLHSSWNIILFLSVNSRGLETAFYFAIVY